MVITNPLMPKKKPYAAPRLHSGPTTASAVLLACTRQTNCGDFGFIPDCCAAQPQDCATDCS